jgi:hypothetical protein
MEAAFYYSIKFSILVRLSVTCQIKKVVIFDEILLRQFPLIVSKEFMKNLQC